MNRSLYQLLLVHFKTFFREPAIIFWAVLFPIIMAWILGVAFSGKGESQKTVYVVRGDGKTSTAAGEKIVMEEAGSRLTVELQAASEQESVRAIKRGVISLYIEEKEDSLIYHFDPANPDAQLLYLMLERELSGAKPENAAISPLEAKGTRYIDFLIPGLIALGIMNSCLWGIGWSLIEMRMKKLLRRMVATPLKKSVFMTSYLLTRVVLGGFETVLLLLFASLYFGTDITGSIPAFVVVFLAGIFAFGGIGILTASRTAKTEVANGLVNAVTLSMMILSGIFFNYHNFPDWATPVIQALPLTLLADAIRSIFIEGAGLSDVAMPILILLATGLVTFVAGLRIFKWY